LKLAPIINLGGTTIENIIFSEVGEIEQAKILRNIVKTGKWGVFIEKRKMRSEPVSKALFRTRFFGAF
jgi:Zn-dependent M16 (insulinase) family peptidase